MPLGDEQTQKAQSLLNEALLFNKTVVHVEEPLENDGLVLIVLNQIPLLNALMKRLNSASSAVSDLIKKNGIATDAVLNINKVNPFVGIALNLIDFLQIPLIYLSAYMLGQKSPITLTNNARWLYATVLLALCVIGVLLPVTAPFVAISSAGLGCFAGIFILTKLWQGYAKDKQSYIQLHEKIDNSPYGNLVLLCSEMKNALDNPLANRLKIESLSLELESSIQQCKVRQHEIQEWLKQINFLEQKMNIESEVLDNSIGIILALTAVAGTVVSLFFPPIGLIILLTAASTGAAYVVTRLAKPSLFEFPITRSFAIDEQLSKSIPLKGVSTKDLLHHLNSGKKRPRRQHEHQLLSESPVITNEPTASSVEDKESDLNPKSR